MFQDMGKEVVLYPSRGLSASAPGRLPACQLLVQCQLKLPIHVRTLHSTQYTVHSALSSFPALNVLKQKRKDTDYRIAVSVSSWSLFFGSVCLRLLIVAFIWPHFI